MDVLGMDVIIAKGHPLIKALHRSTFEITKDDFLTPRGDCIVGIVADKGAADLDREVRSAIANDESIVVLELVVEGIKDVVLCKGSRELKLRDPRKIIVRKSRYIDDATLCIEANKAAKDLDRGLVSRLKDGATLVVKIAVLRGWP